MKAGKGLNIILLVIALVTGSRLILHFDYHNLTFEKPVLDIIYAVTFVICIVFLMRDIFKRTKNKEIK